MVDTIIENFESLGLGDRGKIASLVLKFNSELKKLGFKKAVIGEEYVSSDIIEEGLTIRFCPFFRGREIYMERNSYRDSFNNFSSHMPSLEGSNWGSYYYSLRGNIIEGQIPLKIKHENRSYEIGHYLPNRNVVFLYILILPLHTHF